MHTALRPTDGNAADKMISRLVAAAIGNLAPSPPRMMLWAAAFSIAVISAAFAAYAAYAALSVSLEGYWAAASVAGGAMLLAAILVAVTRLRRRPARPGRSPVPNQDMAPEAFAELMRAICGSPKQAATIALVAGFLAGAYPGLLEAARDLVDPE